MEQQMTTKEMRRFLRAAGQYETEIERTMKEVRDLVGDVMPRYSGWHVSGTRGRSGASAVEQALVQQEKNRRRAAYLMQEILRMKRELAFLDGLGYAWDICNVLRLRYFFRLDWPEIARRVHRCVSTCKQYESKQLSMLTDAWNAAVARQKQTAAAI